MFYDKQEDIDDLILWSDRHGKPAVGGSDEQEIPVGDLPKALQNLYREVEPLMFEDTGILLAEFKHRYGAVIEYCTDILAEFDNASLFADEFLKMERGMAKEAHDLHCTVSVESSWSYGCVPLEYPSSSACFLMLCPNNPTGLCYNRVTV